MNDDKLIREHEQRRTRDAGRLFLPQCVDGSGKKLCVRRVA